MRHSSAALQYVFWVRLPRARAYRTNNTNQCGRDEGVSAFLEGIISIYDGFTLPQTSWAEKYDLLLRDVVPLLPFVVREGLLTEGEILRFPALTVSRLAHVQEDFQRDRRSLNWLAGVGTGRESNCVQNLAVFKHG